MFKVLLVDDEPVILSGLKSLINWEELGMVVAGDVSSGADALRLLERERFDIMLTDVRMPGMDGLELIAEMRRREYPTKIIIVSGYDDFLYVKRAMHYQIENYIVKPIDENELIDTLSGIATKIECEQSRSQVTEMMNSMLLDNVLSAWALNSLDDMALIERLRLFGINLGHRYYLLSTVRLYRLNPSDGKVDRSCEQIRSLIQIHWNSPADFHVTFNYTGDLLIIFACDNCPEVGRIPDLIHHVMNSWPGSVALDWFAAVGETVDHPMNLNQSYHSAMRLLLYHELSISRKVFISEVNRANLCGICTRYGLATDWVEQFSRDNAGAIHDKLALLAKTLTDGTDAAVVSFNETVEVLLHCILSCSKPIQDCIMANHPVPVNFTSFREATSPKEAIQALTAILTDYTHHYPYDAVSVHPLVSRALQILGENYSQELSLKSMAHGFNVSQTHLGRIFKKETGKLFTDYLNDIRIEKAKEMLRNTSLRSNDVAGAVGFGNPNYFSNVFKKRVGVYPTTFRQQGESKP